MEQRTFNLEDPALQKMLDIKSGVAGLPTIDEYYNLMAKFLEESEIVAEILNAKSLAANPSVFFEKVNRYRITVERLRADSLSPSINTLIKYFTIRKFDLCVTLFPALQADIRKMMLYVKSAELTDGGLPEYPSVMDVPEDMAMPESTHVIAEKSPTSPAKKTKIRRVLDIMPVSEVELLQHEIEAFELGKALQMLKKYTLYSFGPHIDPVVDKLYAHVANFDQLNAAIEAKSLVYKIISLANDESMSMNAKKKILAIDDKPDVLNTIKAMLANDYTVYAVTSGDMALKFLSQRQVDLILLDIEMPDMNGHEVLKRIQTSPSKKIPVIFLTGNSTMDNIFAATQSGASDFVAKPVDRNTLLQKIKDCMPK